MTEVTTVVWRCECGRTLISGLPQGLCPHCHSSFGTFNNHRIVLAGSWEVINIQTDVAVTEFSDAVVRIATRSDEL